MTNPSLVQRIEQFFHRAAWMNDAEIAGAARLLLREVADTLVEVSRPKSAREVELETHIRVLRNALQDAPHDTTLTTRHGLPVTYYESWYQQQRGPALESTDPVRWKEYQVKSS